MEELHKLWTNLWSIAPFGALKPAGVGALSEAQRESVDAVFREAVKTTEGKLAIALGRSADELSHNLYVLYEPCATLVVALDPFEKIVSVSIAYVYWDAMEPRFKEATEKAEALLREERIVEALVLCIHQACEWMNAMRALIALR
jgi:hypothetical protein